MTTLDRVNTEFTADGSKFSSEVDKILGKVDGFGKKMDAAAKAVGGFIAIDQTIGRVVDIYNKAADSADRLAKSSDKIGIASEKLVGLRHAAEMSGVSSDKLDQSLVKMSRGIAEAANGTGKASEYLERFGLANQKFFNQTPDQQFAQLADKINTLGSQQEKAAASAALFGDRQANMLNVIADGSAGLAEMQSDAEALGIALSRVDAAKFEAANDAMERSGKAVEGISNRFAVAVAPLVEGLANAFTNAAIESGGFRDVVTGSVDVVVEAVGYTANIVRGLEVVWAGVKAATAEFFASSLEGLARFDKQFVDFANKIPGVRLEYSTFASEAAISMRNVADDAKKSFADLAAKDLPHDGIVKWAEKAQLEATKAAEKVAADRASKFAAPEVSGSGTAAAKAADDKVSKIYEQSQRELDALRDKNDQMYEETMRLHGDLDAAENFRYQKEIERNAAQLENLRAKGVATEEIEQEFRERDALLADQHQVRLAQINKKRKKDMSDLEKFQSLSYKNQSKQVFGELANLTAGVAQHSRGMFRINKIAGIAIATMNTFQGASESLKAYPMPLAAVMAAAHLAAGFAQVNAIRSASFEGAGSGVAPAAAGSGGLPSGGLSNNDILTTAPALATNPQAAQQSAVQIIINGDIHGNDAEKLVEQIKELVDRDYVFISANTAQARALKAA